MCITVAVYDVARLLPCGCSVRVYACVCVQALAGILSVLVMVSGQIRQLQQLQPEGTCVLRGPAGAASKQLQALESSLTALVQEWGLVVEDWKLAVEEVEELMIARRQNIRHAWGVLLSQLLPKVIKRETVAALRDAGAAVVAEFPVKLCCNNPGCTAMGKVGEMRLESTCTGCGAARYCGKACQGLAWKAGHSKVCKHINKEAAAAAKTAQ
jgi:hypothetical protein